jgi:hypothetical protein
MQLRKSVTNFFWLHPPPHGGLTLESSQKQPYLSDETWGRSKQLRDGVVSTAADDDCLSLSVLSRRAQARLQLFLCLRHNYLEHEDSS